MVGFNTGNLDVCFIYSPNNGELEWGNKTSFIQPLVAAINCTIWVCYGFFKKNRDLPLALANLPGIIFGLIAAFTAL